MGTSAPNLHQIIDEFRLRLAEAEDMLKAIRMGEVDALVINGPAGEQVYTLKGADHVYRIIVEEMSEAAITLSTDGTILYCNSRFADLVKKPLEEIMGASFEAFVAEEHEAAFRALLREQGKARAEIALRAGNGAGIPVYISSSRVMIDSCEAVCLIATDLTEQKREETSLAEEQRRIEERIRANDQLAAMGMAAAALAHEIANPLHWISTTVQLMQRELAGGSQAATPSWKESLANIHKEINRMGAMLQEFRSLARPMKLNVAPLDLREFIAEVEKVIVAELNSAAIRLERDISTELPRVHVDEQKLQQVLLNIYKNAVEAMPSGGTLTAKAYPEAGNVVIEISDTGLGIPEDIDIFEPFTTTKDKGTGLGLMIVRQIIAAHAGSISYRSKQDEGTTFHIVLPCSVKNTEQRQKS